MALVKAKRPRYIGAMTQLTPSSLRAARAFLDWSQRDLVEKSGVGRATIEAIEAESGARSARASTVAKLIATFAEHGVAIIPPPADGVVRIPRA
jgi:predicted transcriptional regulator